MEVVTLSWHSSWVADWQDFPQCHSSLMPSWRDPSVSLGNTGYEVISKHTSSAKPISHNWKCNLISFLFGMNNIWRKLFCYLSFFKKNTSIKINHRTVNIFVASNDKYLIWTWLNVASTQHAATCSCSIWWNNYSQSLHYHMNVLINIIKICSCLAIIFSISLRHYAWKSSTSGIGNGIK